MGSFNDWKGTASAPGFLESLKAFCLKDGQIDAGAELPGDEEALQSLAVEAIVYSGEAKFSLDSNSGGAFHAYGFGGLFWWTDGDGNISGPFSDLESTVAMLISMAEPNWCCSASGDFPDEFIVAQCGGLVEVGESFEINGNPYVQTATGLVRQ